jgi:hypothetical protein
VSVNSDLVQLDELEVEEVESEKEDQDASLRTYEILTYPADFTLEVLVDKFHKDQILIPKFQRKFVWNQVQASKLIESFLLGLPVPAIFLYTDPETNKSLVVDGQQRLKTIAYFFEGYFGPEERERRPVFRLKGLDESSPFLGKTYQDLSDVDPPAYLRLNDAVLRAFVIKQLDPEDSTSIYHVFERLNTGGTFLNPQEVRNCVRHGPLNDALMELNDFEPWRKILGRQKPDKRLRDVELILRFLALLHWGPQYAKPMKDFLNKFMDEYREVDMSQLDAFASQFRCTTEIILEALGGKPFHIRAGINAAAFDATYTAIAKHLDDLPSDLGARYSKLKSDGRFSAAIGSGTTDREVVHRRAEVAEEILCS